MCLPKCWLTKFLFDVRSDWQILTLKIRVKPQTQQPTQCPVEPKRQIYEGEKTSRPFSIVSLKSQ